MRERLRTDYQWTTRQRQVLDLMARGKSNAEIAETLGISLQGAKWHVSEVMSKLQSDSREEAADYWRRYNGIPPRFARVFRGLVGLSVVKWAGAATVAAIVAAGGIAIAVVASGGGDDLPSARATTTPGLLESLPSIAAGKEAVQATDPLAASLVESALRGDVDAHLPGDRGRM